MREFCRKQVNNLFSATEQEDPMLFNSQQFMFMSVQWTIIQTGERRQGVASSSDRCSEQQSKGDWRRLFLGAKFGGRWLTPQAKKDTGKEEWWCKQAAESTLQQEHLKVFMFRKQERPFEVYKKDPSYRQEAYREDPSQVLRKFPE